VSQCGPLHAESSKRREYIRAERASAAQTTCCWFPIRTARRRPTEASPTRSSWCVRQLEPVFDGVPALARVVFGPEVPHDVVRVDAVLGPIVLEVIALRSGVLPEPTPLPIEETLPSFAPPKAVGETDVVADEEFAVAGAGAGAGVAREVLAEVEARLRSRRVLLQVQRFRARFAFTRHH
jgi:hypothetical protein